MSHNLNQEPVGAHAVGPRPHRRPWWLWLLLALAALLLLFLLLSRCNTDSPQNAQGNQTSIASSPTTSLEPSPGPPTPTEPSPTAVTPTEATPSDATASTPADAGKNGALTIGGKPLLPLAKPGASENLSAFVDKPVTATSVRVQSVDADEGFWVGDNTTNRVWVQLVGKSGESSYQVKAGDRLTFTGKLVTNPRFSAENVGVSAEEGAAQLSQQKNHVEVDKNKLTQN